MTNIVVNLPKELGNQVFSYIMPDLGIQKDIAESIRTYLEHQMWIVDMLDKRPQYLYRFMHSVGNHILWNCNAQRDEPWYNNLLDLYVRRAAVITRYEKSMIVSRTLMRKISAEKRALCIRSTFAELGFAQNEAFEGLV